MGDSEKVQLTRRKLIAISSTGIAALAGCSGGGGDSTPTPTATPTPTPTPEPEPDFELRSLDVSKPAADSSDVTVTAIVGNVGEAEGTAELQVSIGPLSQSFEQEIAVGEGIPVEGSMDTSAIEAGSYNLTATVGGGEMMESLTLYPELQHGLNGRVTSPTGDSLVNAELRFYSPQATSGGGGTSISDDDGFFSTSHLADVPYDLTGALLAPDPGVDDGIPAISDLLDGYRVTDEKALVGAFTIPEGYLTQVQFVDSNGDPISNFEAMGIYGESGMGAGHRYTTNDEGYVIATGADEPGIAAPGEDDHALIFRGREEGEPPEKFGEIYGSPDGAEYTFAVENPDRFGSR